ncbi:MAG: hypothetical protein AABW79_01925 [Nanoarchaeota archaeon]
MDYANPQRRKNKNDRKAKARAGRYKVGGKYRSANIQSAKSK